MSSDKARKDFYDQIYGGKSQADHAEVKWYWRSVEWLLVKLGLVS